MEAGQTIGGKYKLNHLLGEGGMAAVWSATNLYTEREFAIKFLLPQVAKTKEAKQRFMMEAKVSGRVQHPNVIEVLDVGQTEDGTLYLVMELLRGTSLEHAMRRQNPPLRVYEFAAVMLDVARALAAAHRAGIIHRDLKPSNVFLHRDRDGVAVPKLLDFGVSKFLLDEDRNNALTIAGTVLGSPLYMSPEQAMGATDVDHRTDIFGFGGILFEGLCGFRPYEAANFNALIVTIATQQPKNVDVYAPHMPEEIRALTRQCLVVDRRQRIDNFDAIAERLKEALPALEPNPLRLPPHLHETMPPKDPDTTDALPAIIRPSDRPPSSSNQASPATGFAVGTPAQKKEKLPIVLFVAPAVGFAALLVVILIVVGISRMQKTEPRVTTPKTVDTSELTNAVPSSSADPPVLNVDSLPVTTKPPKGIGHLSVNAQPGWCSLFVDGKPQGPTPIVSLEVTAGAHVLRCESPKGKMQVVNVTVMDGQVLHHKFTIE